MQNNLLSWKLVKDFVYVESGETGQLTLCMVVNET